MSCKQFKVQLWLVIRIKTDEKTAPEEKSFTRAVELPFAPTKGMLLVEEDKEHPWLFVCNMIGYNITHDMFNCEYAVETDAVKFESVHKSLLGAGWVESEK